MFSLPECLLSCVILLLYSSKTCSGDIPSPSLALFIPGELEFTEVLVRRQHDNLSLVCELRGDATPRAFVWNYMGDNGTVGDVILKGEPKGLTTNSTLTKHDLQISDSGQYICSAPPFSVTKYILVQGRGPTYCRRGAFWCGQRCIAAQYLCDGRRDCERAEDEAGPMCPPHVCSGSDKLNCSSGRCLSESACCRTSSSLCQHPSCCDEHPRYSRLEGFVDVEYPPLFEDRHAGDDYGFIQSTIYTVTACALIFMIAVVLLVSAICKMHMKRAALRSYAHADRATRHHYSVQYAQTHRFPPCYEASRLLEAERGADSPADTPHAGDRPQVQQSLRPESPVPEPPPDAAGAERAGFGLARLSAIFSSRYRQVPTQSDVELTNVRSSSLNNSPTRNRTLDNYRSPTYCDLNASEFYFTNPETGDFGRDLNYMAAPVDYMRRSNTALERVIDHLDRQRLTLQLGRFQLTIPRFGRRSENDRRPDTPNVAEINIDDLDFVRMTSHDTYTLNGRTIRLLGANFENYPVLPDGTRPPPYNEAMRCKFFGPPPEYLSREGLNSRVDEEARNNVEMPPCYDELATGENSVSQSNPSCSNDNVENNGNTRAIAAISNASDENNVTSSGLNNATSNGLNNVTQNNNVVTNPVAAETVIDSNMNNVQSISSIINNLPAIDSDVNANDTAINC
uniref:Ig-like domain-containing protein n=1 Tax=Heliothis virescens TaxID=7102 RepID=A0A2A4K794_HELVI